jgi:hypothetical protein
MRNFYYIIILIILIFISCDEGLSPDLADEEVGFGGTITFSGEWDQTINQTHVVVFKQPLLDVSDFNVFNLKYVSSSIPNGTTSYKYSTNDEEALISSIEPGTVSYIAVAQSLKDTITLNREDWIVIGIYYEEGDSLQPGSLIIPEAGFVGNVNIYCDFNNLPPQPPGGITNKE